MNKQNLKFNSMLLGAVALFGMSANVLAVDGVVLITQSSAMAGNPSFGDAPNFPVTIKQPGSYRLAGNLTPGNLTAFIITAEQVTLDLNGFSITGSGSTIGKGIEGGNSVVVTNGIVRNFGSYGIVLGSRSRIEKVQILLNGMDGIKCSTNCLIIGNTVVENAYLTDGISVFSGIATGFGSTVGSNVIYNNKGNGIWIGTSSLVIDNTVTLNGTFNLQGDYFATGLRCSDGTVGYVRNIMTYNGTGGNDAQSDGNCTNLGSNICGTDTICP